MVVIAGLGGTCQAHSKTDAENLMLPCCLT